MSNGSDNSQPPTPKASAPKARNGLRLVRPEPVSKTPAATDKARSRSNLGRLLSAYADAIDRDVRLILET